MPDRPERCSVCHPFMEETLNLPGWTIPRLRKVQDAIVATGEVLKCGEERTVCTPLKKVTLELDKFIKQAEE